MNITCNIDGQNCASTGSKAESQHSLGQYCIKAFKNTPTFG